MGVCGPVWVVDSIALGRSVAMGGSVAMGVSVVGRSIDGCL